MNGGTSMFVALLVTGCHCRDPEPRPEPEPDPVPTGVTGETGATGETGDMSASGTGDTAAPVGPPELALGPLERWSLDDESEPQHHTAVTWTRDGHLAVAWTWGESYDAPATWLRVFRPDGAPLAEPVQVGVGLFASKPDLDDTVDGHLVVGAEVDGVGIGVERVTLPSLTLTRTLLAGAAASIGSNAVDLVVRDDNTVLATWYAGALGQPAGYYLGGLDAAGAVAPPEVFTMTEHLWPGPPDIAVDPSGGFVVGWSHVEVDAEGQVVDIEARLTAFAPDRSVRATYPLASFGPELLTPPRPTVAINGRGQLAVGYNTEPGPEAWVTSVELGQPLVVLRAPWSLGPHTDRVALAFLDDDTVVAVWEGPRLQDPQQPSVWMGIFGFPDGRELVAPQRISPEVNAQRPNLDVREADGRYEIAIGWEQLNAEGRRAVWGLRATWGPPDPP